MGALLPSTSIFKENFMEKRNFVLLWLLLIGLMFSSCSRQLQSVYVGNEPVIYPPPPAKTRIQYLTSIGSSQDIMGKRSGFSRFVLGEAKSYPVVKPYGLAVSANRVVICDAGLCGLELIDLEKKSFLPFIPKGRGQLKAPVNCCLDTDGTLYVADPGRKQIVVFDKENQYIDAFGEAENAKTTDVAVTTDRIYVPDAGHNRVLVYQKANRKLLFSFPDSLNSAEGHLFQPINICISGNLVYVTDVGDSKIKSYTLDGRYQASVGSFGNTPGQFIRPKGIDVDRDGILYAVDAGFENVQMFNKEGQILMNFGGPYKGPGDMCLPAKVVVDYQNLAQFEKFVHQGFNLKYLIFVTNQFGSDKINVYGAVDSK